MTIRPKSLKSSVIDKQEKIDLVSKFYTAFQNKDYEAMSTCYSENIHFYDPVFQDLNGYEVGGMWRMLIERSKSLEIKLSSIGEEGELIKAKWEAKYPFGKTNRPVHNKIVSQFNFTNGLISEHIDTFNLWSWSRMALGFSGLLLGWSPSVKSKIRKEAQSGLRLFIKRKRLS